MEPRDLASQLRCPDGEQASDVARGMNEVNRLVNQKCVALLGIKAADNILEIGPGNGAFTSEIVSAADNVRYTGLDWSAEMVAEAQQINKELLMQGCVDFQQGSSDMLPFATACFDKVLTVHTLYFWEHLLEHLAEIRRVIKPGGLFCMAFGDRVFMEDLPFVPFGFNLYDAGEAQKILQQSGFDVLDVHQHHEVGRSNTGQTLEKLINIIISTVADDERF